MTDLIEQIITRALLEGCDNHKDRAALARETARQVMEGCRRQLYRLSDDGRVEPVPSYDEGIKEGLRRAAETVKGNADTITRFAASGWRGNPHMSGDDRNFMHSAQRRKHDERFQDVTAYLSEAILSLLPKEEGR